MVIVILLLLGLIGCRESILAYKHDDNKKKDEPFMKNVLETVGEIGHSISSNPVVKSLAHSSLTAINTIDAFENGAEYYTDCIPRHKEKLCKVATGVNVATNLGTNTIGDLIIGAGATILVTTAPTMVGTTVGVASIVGGRNLKQKSNEFSNDVADYGINVVEFFEN